VVPQEWFDRFPLDQIVLPLILPGDKADCHYERAVGTELKGPLHYRELAKSYPRLDDGLRAYLRGYLASIAFADHQVGRVLAALEQSRFAKNTIVVLTSDNGYNLGQKEYLFKNSLWEESSRIPLIVRAPGYAGSAGAVVTHPVSLLDILPTVTDLCGVKDAARADGHSLRPFLEQPARSDWPGPPVALSIAQAGGQPKLAGLHHFSVRSARWRYVRYADGSEELYDHAVDPYEWENLADSPAHAAVKQELLGQMRALAGTSVAL
jgi:arylsulfatase A-like enzyme